MDDNQTINKNHAGLGLCDKATLGFLFASVITVIVFAVFSDDIFHEVQTATDTETVLPELSHLKYGTHPDAKVTLVEFMDYQCPFTLEQRPVMLKILEEGGSDINYVKKHFPSPAHPLARELAGASVCISFLEPEKLNEFEDKVFSSQNMFDLDVFTKSLGSKIGDCLIDPSTQKIVQQDIDEGVRAGVVGTPTIFLNGKPLRGVQSYAKLRLMTDSLIEIEKSGDEKTSQSKESKAE